MAIRFHLPALSFLDANGDPVNGAKANFYEAGTTTRLDTYSDEDLTSANANPVVADSAGKFGDIWLKSQAYKVIITDADDVVLTTMDPVNGSLAVSGDKFKVSPQDPADMTVSVGAGTLFNLVSKAIVTKSAQTSASITAPTVNPRHDIVYADRLTGVIGIDTGAEGAIPADPTISDDKVPLARITLAITTTEIGDSLITDIRELANIGTGAAAVKTIGVADGNIPVMDATGYPAADGSQITGIVHVLRGHIDGLTLSNDGVDAAKDLDIAAGEAADDGKAVAMILASALIKKLDAAWAVGTNAGALDGSESVGGTPDADTWYHIWLIRRSDTGVVDILASESATAPTMPTNYDQKRRIGAVLFDATPDIITFTQDGDEFLWGVPVQDYAASSVGTSAVLRTMAVPTGIQVRAKVSVSVDDNSTSRDYGLVTSPDQTDTTPSINNFNLGKSNSSQMILLSDYVRTNMSGQIRVRYTDSGAGIVHSGDTLGWIDPRGRNA